MMTKSIGFYYFICGKLLGDGCITRQERRKPRFQFMHRTEDFGWANHCYEQLKNHIPLNPPTYRKVIDVRLRKGYSESFIVQSRTDEVITQLYRQWYPTGKKKLPFDFIEILFGRASFGVVVSGRRTFKNRQRDNNQDYFVDR